MVYGLRRFQIQPPYFSRVLYYKSLKLVPERVISPFFDCAFPFRIAQPPVGSSGDDLAESSDPSRKMIRAIIAFSYSASEPATC
jgi:hypothetical protein